MKQLKKFSCGLEISSRTGANDLELLLPLANSIIENWKIGTFEQIMLIKNNQQIGYNQIYEY